jgi:hypothetical protein
VNLDAMLRAADLSSAADRRELSDALEDAGRDGEAALLRGTGTVALWLYPNGDAEAVAWFTAATDTTQGAKAVARCTLAEWLEHGAAVVKCNPWLVRVDITDRRPLPTVRGNVEWYAVAASVPESAITAKGAGVLAVVRAVMSDGLELAVVHRYATEAEAMADLSRRCLLWARRQAAESDVIQAFDAAPSPAPFTDGGTP